MAISHRVYYMGTFLSKSLVKIKTALYKKSMGNFFYLICNFFKSMISNFGTFSQTNLLALQDVPTKA
jgi:hypothetical protein